MRNLELKDICGYLPYGLKCTAMGEWDEGEDYVDESTPKIFTMSGVCTDSNSERYVEGMYDNDMHTIYFPDDFTPILRPISDLTKTITYKGETFVPIVELAKIAKLPYSDIKPREFYNDEYRASCDWIVDKIRWRFQLRLNIINGVTNTSFGYFPPYKLSYDYVNSQLEMFDKLSEWMFDFRGLLDANLALPVTEEFNPYKL